MTIQDIMDIQQDKRYSINKEYCGYKTKRFVLRFCGDFITSAENKNLCYYKAVQHHNQLTNNE